MSRKEKRILGEYIENKIFSILKTTRVDFQNVLKGSNREKYINLLNELVKTSSEKEKESILTKNIDSLYFQQLYEKDMQKWRDDCEEEDDETEFTKMLFDFISTSV